LYRICVTLPDRARRLTGQLASKLCTHWALILLVAALPAHADVADTLQSVKPGVVGVGVFNPSGSPHAKLLDSEKKKSMPSSSGATAG
jgi:hypothetical protein